MSKFPKFNTVLEARCFHCDAILVNVRESAYHDGRYQGDCSCGFHTWFDMPDNVTLAPCHDVTKDSAWRSDRAAVTTYHPGTMPALVEGKENDANETRR